MADINDYLDTIANGVYGRDVRAAIVNAIQTCYNDGKSGATDQTARSSIQTINNKIGTANISAVGPDMTTAINTLFNRFTIRKIDPPVTLRVGIHDWVYGFFSGGDGTPYSVSFIVPLYMPVNRSDFPPETSGSVTVAWTPNTTTQFRSVGQNGWREISRDVVQLSNATIVPTYGCSNLLVSIPLSTAIPQPKNTTALISTDMTFTFVGKS